MPSSPLAFPCKQTRIHVPSCKLPARKRADFPSSAASGCVSAAKRAHLKMMVVEEEVVVQTQPQEEEEVEGEEPPEEQA